MFNFSKIMTQTKSLMSLRISAPVYNLNFSTTNVNMKTVEEKAGIPPRPKRPLTPFFRFLQEQRPIVSRESPKLNHTQVVQEISKRWNAVDEAQKISYNEGYIKEREVWTKEKARYDSSLTEEQKELIDLVKQDIADSREKRALKKRNKEMEKPKRPMTGYFRYLSKRYADNDRGDLEPKVFLKKIAEEWKSMSEEQKKPYNSSYEEDAKAYRQNLAKWELKMIRMGYTELVRQESLVDVKPKPKSRRSRVDSSDSD